jgi:hypothetical protein
MNNPNSRPAKKVHGIATVFSFFCGQNRGFTSIYFRFRKNNNGLLKLGSAGGF